MTEIYHISLDECAGVAALHLVVRDEIARIRALRAKGVVIYSTEAPCSNPTTIYTTSKDVHLALGAMSWDGREAFGEFLDDSLKNAGVDRMTLGGVGRKSLLVVRTTESEPEHRGFMLTTMDN